MTISVCMIVKNEEKNLAACLDCLKEIADEIVIVDTGSEDNTKAIAAEYTYMILYGREAFLMHVILLFPKRKWTIFTVRMRMSV